MADANDNQSAGGGSPLGSPSDDDEKLMRKGKGRMLAGMIVAGVAALAGIIIYMVSGEDEAYAKFGKAVNGIDQQHFDQFWGCVFKGYDLERIKNNEHLRRQIHLRAERRPQAFGKYLRDECMPKLEEMDPKLTELIPPEELEKPLEGMDKPPIPALVDATERLRSGFSGYVSYLDTAESYDRESDKVDENIDTIVRAWFDYKSAFGKLNKKLKEHLGPA